jgi:A/G-specific adenine glycosylase
MTSPVLPIARVVPALRRWFAGAKRDLPWRRVNPRTGRRNPYHVLVSEIMLQQTQVSRVEPAFRAFVRRFPSVRSLARAHPDDVRRAWSGLGYYRRAMLLHRAAAEIVSRFAGRVPDDADALRSLPGVGRYTAGAVASIAFARPAPIVDGNVLRVLIRLAGRDGAADDPDSLAWAWTQAERLVGTTDTEPIHDPGEINEALMEFGALVCTPAAPRCDACPLAGACGALRAGRVAEIPRPKRAPRRERLDLHVLVLTDARGRVLLTRRPEGALWGGLWAPPDAHDEPAARTLAARLGATLAPAGVVERTLTHRRLVLHVWRGETARARASTTRRWVPPADLAREGAPSAHRAAVALALGDSRTKKAPGSKPGA